MDIKISPSLMCADQLFLKDEINKLEEENIDSFHIDIMDGHLVDNFGFNFQVIKGIKKITNIPLDLHLYIDNPVKYIKKFVEIGGDTIYFHVEVSNSPLRLIKMIKSLGAKAGIALYPSTPIENYEYLFELLDKIMVLTVEPGFSGQSFIISTIKKIKKIRNIIKKKDLNIDIGVDGNINVENAVMSINAGANVLVCGTSAIFYTKDIVNNLKMFRYNLKTVLGTGFNHQRI